MENLLYLPINSANFNAIFSTESISPGCYYKNRKFGSKRFWLNTANPYEDALLLYNFIPEAEPFSSHDESFVFYLTVSDTAIKGLFLLTDGPQKVWACMDTIYLDFVHPIFLFVSAEHRKIIVAKSLASFEAKAIDKYAKRFHLISELGKKLERIQHEIPIQLQDDEDVQKNLDRDEIINSFKGLIYCQAIARNRVKSEKEVGLRNSIRTVTNSWSSYVSALSLLGGRKKNTKNPQRYQTSKGIEGFQQSQNMLNKALDEFLREVSKFVAPVDIASNIQKLLQDRKLNDTEINGVFSVMDRVPEIKDHLYQITEKSDPSIYYEIRGIKKEIEKNSNIGLYAGAVSPKNLDRIYNTLTACFEKTMLLTKGEQEERETESEIGMNYKLAGKRIEYLRHRNDIDQKYAVIHESIINMLCENNKGSVGEVTLEHINNFVVNVGNMVKEIFGENSNDRINLISFYQFLNGKQLDFDFKLLSSAVLQNFGAFALKNKSLEELISFGEQKYLASSDLSLEYWGVFNGFAAIGKTHTQFLMSNKELNAQMNILLKDLLAETLPYIKDISLDDLVIEDKSNVVQQVEELTFDKLFEPIMKNVELRQFAQWIERCVEQCVLSLVMEYDGLSPEEVLKKDLSSELFDKNRPKGFNVGHVDKVIDALDFDLFNKLKTEKQR